MKLDFKVVLLTDACRAKLEGPDGGVMVGSQIEATVPFASDDNMVEVASCFRLGSLVMTWLAHENFPKV